MLEPELKKLQGRSTPDDWYWYCWELAGIVGVDPGPRTLAELMAMAKGRQRAEWERTAQLSALIGAIPTATQESIQKPFEPWEFNPFADEEPPKVEEARDQDERRVPEGAV